MSLSCESQQDSCSSLNVSVAESSGSEGHKNNLDKTNDKIICVDDEEEDVVIVNEVFWPSLFGYKMFILGGMHENYHRWM